MASKKDDLREINNVRILLDFLTNAIRTSTVGLINLDELETVLINKTKVMIASLKEKEE